MNEHWSRKPPEAPDQKPSLFYWYLDDNENDLWVVEVWPNRYLDHFKGWWYEFPAERPLTKPNRKVKKIEETTEKKKSYRGKGLLG